MLSAPPPPPPPVPAPSFSSSNGRANLLADIRKGATLKKTPVNKNKEDAILGQCADMNQTSRSQTNDIDAEKKLTKDLLQAELCSTLKRRKPVAIVEPPKYQYPTYDNYYDQKDVVESRSLGDLSNANINSNNNKPIKNILSVVTKTKIPDEIIEKIIPNEQQKSSENQANNKPMITHAKPNFTLPRKVNSNANKNDLTNGVIHNNNNNNASNGTNNSVNGLNNSNTMKKVIVSDDFKPKIDNIEKDVVDMKSEQLVNNTSSVTITINNSPAPPPLPVKSITTKPVIPSVTSTVSSVNSSITSDIVQTSNGITKIQLKKVPSDSNSNSKKMFISHGKPNFVVKTCDKMKPVSSKETLNSKQQSENYLEVKIKSLKPQKSRDDSLTTVNDNKFTLSHLNNSSQYSIATECNNSLKNAIKSLKSHKLVDEVDASPKLIHNSFVKNGAVNYNGNNTLSRKISNCNEQKYMNNINHSSSLPFSKVVSESSNNKVMHHASVMNGNGNFEQKTVVSFSKDLQEAPNQYPEKIKVTKTITTKSETTTVVQQSVFSNIKFVIGADGQVLQNTHQ